MRRILPVRPLDDHFAVQLDLIGKLLRGEMTMGKKHAARNTCAHEIKWIENSPVCRCVPVK